MGKTWDTLKWLKGNHRMQTMHTILYKYTCCCSGYDVKLQHVKMLNQAEYHQITHGNVHY